MPTSASEPAAAPSAPSPHSQEGNSLVQQFVNVTLSGLIQGSVFAAFALALVLIWRSTRIVNFAQGSMAAATSFIALALIQSGQSYWVALIVALVSGFLLGAVVERVIVR